jgi:enoyl-CoA hydratase/carnithine racemase
MTFHLDAGTFRDLLADPAAAEGLSTVAGSPLLVVEVSNASQARWLDGLDITLAPAVVIAVARDPGSMPPGAWAAADIVLTEDGAAGAPFVAPQAGIGTAIDKIAAVLAARPVAGTSLALLLRSSASLAVPAALIAESATYSALQAGAEFQGWRSGRPRRPPEPGSQRVLTAQDGSRLEITLARPARRNAVDRLMRDDLTRALAQAVADPGVQVALRALGPDFCAGGDLDEFGTRPDPAIAHLIRLTRSPALLMSLLAGRTTAYLHGACLGAGIELPAFAGRVIAAEDARFGLPEIQLGLVPGAGGTASLPRRIGRWRTAYLALAGQVIGARQALDWGLVDAIAAPPGTGTAP